RLEHVVHQPARRVVDLAERVGDELQARIGRGYDGAKSHAAGGRGSGFCRQGGLPPAPARKSFDMPKTTAKVALVKISKMCAALPETARELMNSHAAFTVRGKKFAYLLDNHHGDGILALCFRGAPGEQQAWIELDTKRYFKPAYIGAQ